MQPSLSLLAGPDALRILRERGLRAEDVDVVPGASGGPKWLVLAALDRFLFGEFLQVPRARPLDLIGSSIGSWRLACLALKDPAAALDRAHAGYIEQRYPHKPSAQLVTETSVRLLDTLLSPTGRDEILAHPWARLHVLTTLCRGPFGSERRSLQMAGLALAAAGNLATRRALAFQTKRVIFHAAGRESPFRDLSDFPTMHVPLTAENVGPALMASASIPLVLSGVRVPGAPDGVFRDGGVIDYHLDLDFGPGEGLVLFPHFYPHMVPGWFDKALRWRRARPANFRRALVLCPSTEFVARLPGRKIPDRKDFVNLSDGERIAAWNEVVRASAELASELGELLASGRIADHVRPL